jgi:hypothetical protein
VVALLACSVGWDRKHDYHAQRQQRGECAFHESPSNRYLSSLRT